MMVGSTTLGGRKEWPEKREEEGAAVRERRKRKKELGGKERRESLYSLTHVPLPFFLFSFLIFLIQNIHT